MISWTRASKSQRLTPHLSAVLLALADAPALLLPGRRDVAHAQLAVSLIKVQGGGVKINFEGERALGFETGFDGSVVTEVELRTQPDNGTGTKGTAMRSHRPRQSRSPRRPPTEWWSKAAVPLWRGGIPPQTARTPALPEDGRVANV